jgi:chloramphenicol-sensitive protein RarD
VPAPDSSRATSGVLVGLIAFVSWGLVPLYWKLIDDVSADRIVAHRAIWCLAFLALVVGVSAARRDTLREVLKSPRSVAFSALAGWLIGINWFIYIWAVIHDHVIEASLGYFLSPLVTVALGALVLGERLPTQRWIAVTLASVGVLLKVVLLGTVPWIALSLCSTWGCYALVKKLAGLDSITGLIVESTSILPPALLYLAFAVGSDSGPSFAAGWPRVPLLLIGGGVITAVPLLCYAYATRRLTLATLGLLQYLTPTMTFLLGVFLFREPFVARDLFTFGCIWAGLVLYSTSSAESR